MDQFRVILLSNLEERTFNAQNLGYQLALCCRFILVAAALSTIAIVTKRPWLKENDKNPNIPSGCVRAAVCILGAIAVSVAAFLDSLAAVLSLSRGYLPGSILIGVLPGVYLAADLAFTLVLISQIRRCRKQDAPRPFGIAMVLWSVLFILDCSRWGKLYRGYRASDSTGFSAGLEVSYVTLYFILTTGMLGYMIKIPSSQQVPYNLIHLTIATTFLLWVGKVFSLALVIKYMSTKTMTMRYIVETMSTSSLYNASNATRDLLGITLLVLLALISYRTNIAVKREFRSPEFWEPQEMSPEINVSTEKLSPDGPIRELP